VSDRTRVLFGICPECKAIIEKHVSPSDDDVITLKATMKGLGLLPADRTVDDVNKQPARGYCPHHAHS
jgi:hypothetical protein